MQSVLSTGHKGAPETTCSLGRGLLCLPAAGAPGVRVAGRGGAILPPLPTHLRPRTTHLVPTQDGPRGQCTPPPKCLPPRKPLPSPGEPLMAKLGSSPLFGDLCQGTPPPHLVPGSVQTSFLLPPSMAPGSRAPTPQFSRSFRVSKAERSASSLGQGQKHRGRDLDRPHTPQPPIRDFTLAKIPSILPKTEAGRGHPVTHCSPFWGDRDPLPAGSPSQGKLGHHELRPLHCSGEKGT